MCNEYDRLNRLTAFTDEEFSRLVPVRWAGGAIPNLEQQPSIKITDRAIIVRQGDEGPEASMTPWAWTQNGRPVFNFRSEGRSFANSERCLIAADALYDFMDRAEGGKGRKHKFRFAMADGRPFWIAGLVKRGAFTMLTTEPGPDVAPIHPRQVVVLSLGDGKDWLNLVRPERELLKPSPAGTLVAQQIA